RIAELRGHGGDMMPLIEKPDDLPVDAFDRVGAGAIAMRDLGGGQMRGKRKGSGHDENLLTMGLLTMGLLPVYPVLSTRIPYDPRYLAARDGLEYVTGDGRPLRHLLDVVDEDWRVYPDARMKP